jgi:hypothetical protein
MMEVDRLPIDTLICPIIASVSPLKTHLGEGHTMTIGYPRTPNDDERRRAKEQELKDAASTHGDKPADTHARKGFFARLFRRRSAK